MIGRKPSPTLDFSGGFTKPDTTSYSSTVVLFNPVTGKNVEVPNNGVFSRSPDPAEAEQQPPTPKPEL